MLITVLLKFMMYIFIRPLFMSSPIRYIGKNKPVYFACEIATCDTNKINEADFVLNVTEKMKKGKRM